jgi:hypothetical protein
MPETVMTGESIAALICVPLLIVGLLAAAYVLRRWDKTNDLTDGFERASVKASWIAALVGVLIAGAGLWWGMYPWKWEYHQWQPVSGTVATVDSRLVPTGAKSMEDKFVVTFDGNPQQYGVLDTRAATLRKGDDLVITCVKRWQWSGTHGYDCNFVSMTKGN